MNKEKLMYVSFVDIEEARFRVEDILTTVDNTEQTDQDKWILVFENCEISFENYKKIADNTFYLVEKQLDNGSFLIKDNSFALPEECATINYL